MIGQYIFSMTQNESTMKKLVTLPLILSIFVPQQSQPLWKEIFTSCSLITAGFLAGILAHRAINVIKQRSSETGNTNHLSQEALDTFAEDYTENESNTYSSTNETLSEVDSVETVLQSTNQEESGSQLDDMHDYLLSCGTISLPNQIVIQEHPTYTHSIIGNDTGHPTQQDFFAEVNNPDEEGIIKKIYALSDGHGIHGFYQNRMINLDRGISAAVLAATSFCSQLLAQPIYSKAECISAIHKTTDIIERIFAYNKYLCTAGSTLSAIVETAKNLYCAWIGDSPIILVGKNGNVYVSRPHTADYLHHIQNESTIADEVLDDLEEIRKKGGTLKTDKHNGYRISGLQAYKTLGDFFYNEDGWLLKAPGILGKPTIAAIRRSDILAAILVSDGVLKTDSLHDLPSQANAIAQVLCKGILTGFNNPESIVESVCKQNYAFEKREYEDLQENTTVAAIFF